MTPPPPNLDRLLKPCPLVARFGEMDLAKWWSTKGQPERLGASALRRDFPRGHRFAQERSALAVASHRCTEGSEPPGCVTLWRLLDATEEEPDARWEQWLDNAAEWTPFFEKLETAPGTDLAAIIEHVDPIFFGDRKTAAMQVLGLT